jgi:hypothetical protein
MAKAGATPPYRATIPLSGIVRLDDMQTRLKGTDPALARQYKEAMDAGHNFPPITLVREGDAFILVDGWHRVMAMEMLGQLTADAEIHPDVSPEVMRLMAYEGNARHGLGPTRPERREMFRAYLKAKRHHKKRKGTFKSYSEMGADLGLPKSTVAAWTRADAPSLAAALGGKAVGAARGRQGPTTADRLAVEAVNSLEGAIAATRGITDGEVRWRLLAQAQGWVDELQLGPLNAPVLDI